MNFDCESIDFHYRDAIRLLFILTGLSNQLDEPSSENPSHIFTGEKRLMALDFYMRYPDYLAHQLLEQYEINNDSTVLMAANEIMVGDEPDIRTILMVRWKHGAYQPIETALSILEAPRLIRTVQDTSKQGQPWTYLIFPKAFIVVQDAVEQQPSLAWYSKQVSALKHIPYQKSGTSLKDGQYSVPEYKKTKIGQIIPPIKEQVLKRLEKLNG
ncbi:MAG: hypothetical protein D3924_09505 [Candidatus Electrothrix sp. AR4]|nr:hypothetical protein [Candidatus Electrothrix sp. AR4]